jgi:hypothetical protein
VSSSEQGEHLPRYFFSFIWPDDVLIDTTGVELEAFGAAHGYACSLVQKVRRRFPDADEDWWVEITDCAGKSTAVLPRMVRGQRPKPDVPTVSAVAPRLDGGVHSGSVVLFKSKGLA